ncbi:hypothetical protein BKA70DRAFT_487425 [Coprinopsis sp. MPI-PUGE-AT-0042]|nr:hypothetical protein BKA70DRAFT_487425 [Coprinopsis sp. MPI-PUGE-AT-0042]
MDPAISEARRRRGSRYQRTVPCLHLITTLPLWPQTHAISLTQLSAPTLLNFSRPFSFDYLPSGEVVALYRVDELESPVEFSAGAVSLNVNFRRSAITLASPDMSRMAIIEDDSATCVWIYNTLLGRQESRLPLPPLSLEDVQYYPPPHGRMWFSWDSSTVYLEQPDGKFYAARLPLIPGSPKDAAVSQLIFSKVDVPTPLFLCLWATGLPHASQLHYLAEGSAWVWLSDEKTWNRIQLPLLPFKNTHTIAYSPSGGLIAIAIQSETRGHDVEGIDIQIRRVPDYDLVVTLHDHQYSELQWRLQFIRHLPHILVANSPIGFTSWDAATGQNIGSSHMPPQSGILKSLHAYNGSDFLCLIETHSTLLVLVAIQLQGADLPEVTQQLCFFPPHLSVLPRICVNPLHPNILAFSTRNGIIQIDISKCPLPFTL